MDGGGPDGMCPAMTLDRVKNRITRFGAAYQTEM
jgi:hypothetical protein